MPGCFRQAAAVAAGLALLSVSTAAAPHERGRMLLVGGRRQQHLSTAPLQLREDAAAEALLREDAATPHALGEAPSTNTNTDVAGMDEVDRLDQRLDCHQAFQPFLQMAGVPAAFMRQPTARETIWNLKHQRLVDEEDADILLDLEPDHDETAFREKASHIMARHAKHCASKDLCLKMAKAIIPGSISLRSCSRERLLTQFEQQLTGVLRSKLLDERPGEGQMLLETNQTAAAQLSTAQIAVQQWGLKTLHSIPPLNSSWNHSDPEGPHQRLDRLVKTIGDASKDLLTPVRQFLEAAERDGAPSNRTGDLLVPLLRILMQERTWASPESLLRDVAVVEFYETRIRKLEIEAYGPQAGVGNRSRHLEHLSALEVPKTRTAKGGLRDGGLAAKASHDTLQSLGRLSNDWKAAIPDDHGALPAYWTGRIMRLRRQIEDQELGVTRQQFQIWTCSYGGGHWAAAKALQDYLADQHVDIVDPTKDVEFRQDDVVGNLIRKYFVSDWDTTWMFNELILRKQLYDAENIVEMFEAFAGAIRGDGTRFQRPCPAPLCDYMDKKQKRKAMLKLAPDFVITTYHMDLMPIMELVQELGGIPIIHLATDMDAKMWEVFGTNPRNALFRLGLPFGVEESLDTIEPVPRSQSFLSGYPVRPAFLRPMPSEAQRRTMRHRRGIENDARVMLVMSGAGGQAVPWPEQLADSLTWHGPPLHIIVVVGSNFEFGRHLETTYLAREERGRHLFLHGKCPSITVEVAKDPEMRVVSEPKYTYYIQEQELVDLMDIADVLLTKPGGSTTAEAAYRGVPTLFDATNGLLHWEAFTVQVFEKHGRGRRMSYSSELEMGIMQTIDLNRSLALVLSNTTGLLNTTQRVRNEIGNLTEQRSLLLPPMAARGTAQVVDVPF